MVCSKRDISPSEGHLRGRSKPKCLKLATLKGPSEWRISKGTTDGHFGLPWSFAQNLCMMTAPSCEHGMMMQKGSSRIIRIGHRDEPFLMERRESFEGLKGVEDSF